MLKYRILALPIAKDLFHQVWQKRVEFVPSEFPQGSAALATLTSQDTARRRWWCLGLGPVSSAHAEYPSSVHHQKHVFKRLRNCGGPSMVKNFTYWHMVCINSAV